MSKLGARFRSEVLLSCGKEIMNNDGQFTGDQGKTFHFKQLGKGIFQNFPLSDYEDDLSCFSCKMEKSK